MISPVIYAGALILSILQFSSMRKSMVIQSMQQTYATTTQALFNSFNSKENFEMSQESPAVSQYYSLAGGPRQYYIIIQAFDMFELIFRLYKTKMIGEEQWLRWESTTEMTLFDRFYCLMFACFLSNVSIYTRHRYIAPEEWRTNHNRVLS